MSDAEVQPRAEARSTPTPTGEGGPSRPTEIVRDTLLEYAERGVLRGFDHDAGPAAPPASSPEGETAREGEPSASFRFFWLGPRPFRITLDDQGRRLTAVGLIPGIEGFPDVRADLERLVEERIGAPDDEGPSSVRRNQTDLSSSLLSHRRVDPEKATVALVPGSEPRTGRPVEDPTGDPTGRPGSSENGDADERARPDHLDLVLNVRGRHHEYAVRKLLNLINEIWVRLQDRHQRYLWKHFDASME